MIVYKIVTTIESKQPLKANFQSFFKNVYTQELSDNSWEHQFLNSPYEDSMLFLAYDNNKIVGSSLMIPQKYEAETKQGSYYLWTTSAVLKEYRSKGVYAELLAMQRDYAEKNKKDFILAFPNKLAYPVVKLFGGFKDLYRTNIVKTTVDMLNFNRVKNSLIIDKYLLQWRFEHKNYLFYEKKSFVIIAKKFKNTLDVLAIYSKESFNDLSLKLETEEIPKEIVTMGSLLKENAAFTIVDTLIGAYYPINKNIDYKNIKLNLLMSDVF